MIQITILPLPCQKQALIATLHQIFTKDSSLLNIKAIEGILTIDRLLNLNLLPLLIRYVAL